MPKKTDAVSAGIANLQATEMSEVRDESTDLDLIQDEVDAIYNEHPDVADDISRSRIHCYVAQFKRYHGLCEYCRKEPRGDYTSGHHVIRIAESIIGNSEHDWKDTVRHEFAHVLAYEVYDENPGHDERWKEQARRVGASDSRCAPTTHTDAPYMLACPNCGHTWGRHKRSKTVKKPWAYHCQDCKTHLVSYDAGDVMPTEPGTCAVSSIGWETKRGYVNENN